MTQPTTCRATNQAGKPCAARHWQDGWCRWHHPDLVDERRAWSAKGGQRRSNATRARRRLPAEAMSTHELYGVVSKALRDVLTGKLDKGVANAAANLARTLTQIGTAVDMTETIEALREQMADFRERLEEVRRGGKQSGGNDGPDGSQRPA